MGLTCDGRTARKTRPRGDEEAMVVFFTISFVKYLHGGSLQLYLIETILTRSSADSEESPPSVGLFLINQSVDRICFIRNLLIFKLVNKS